MSDYVIIDPPEGEAAGVARVLLSLADNVYHVQTDSGEGMRFRVPQYLADRFFATQEEPEAPAEATAKKTSAPRVRRTRKEGT